MPPDLGRPGPLFMRGRPPLPITRFFLGTGEGSEENDDCWGAGVDWAGGWAVAGVPGETGTNRDIGAACAQRGEGG